MGAAGAIFNPEEGKAAISTWEEIFRQPSEAEMGRLLRQEFQIRGAPLDGRHYIRAVQLDPARPEQGGVIILNDDGWRVVVVGTGPNGTSLGPGITTYLVELAAPLSWHSHPTREALAMFPSVGDLIACFLNGKATRGYGYTEAIVSHAGIFVYWLNTDLAHAIYTADNPTLAAAQMAKQIYTDFAELFDREVTAGEYCAKLLQYCTINHAYVTDSAPCPDDKFQLSGDLTLPDQIEEIVTREQSQAYDGPSRADRVSMWAWLESLAARA